MAGHHAKSSDWATGKEWIMGNPTWDFNEFEGNPGANRERQTDQDPYFDLTPSDWEEDPDPDETAYFKTRCTVCGDPSYRDGWCKACWDENHE